METVRSAIEQYKLSDEMQRCAPSTRNRHRLILDLLVTEAGANTPVARLSRVHMDAVLADRRAGGCAESSLNTYRSSLRQVGAWLLDTGLTKRNVAGHLKTVRTSVARSKRKPASADQFRQMLDIAGVRHPRDRVTLLLLVYTGCRGSEITGLRWRDVDLDGRAISVYRGKQRSWFSPPVSVELHDALKAWRDHPLCKDVKPSDFVVPALKRRGFDAGKLPFRMDPSWPLASDHRQSNLKGRIKALLLAVGEQDLRGKGSHTMRRTAANLIFTATGDVRAAQALLGHSSVTVTELYLDQDAATARYGQVIREWTIG